MEQLLQWFYFIHGPLPKFVMFIDLLVMPISFIIAILIAAGTMSKGPYYQPPLQGSQREIEEHQEEVTGTFMVFAGLLLAIFGIFWVTLVVVVVVVTLLLISIVLTKLSPST